MKKMRYKPCLPSIITVYVRSLANKAVELTALVRGQREYWKCSLMCFMETWLNQDIPNDNISISGFQTVQVDRDHTVNRER